MFDMSSPSRSSLNVNTHAFVNDIDYGIQSSAIKRNSKSPVRNSITKSDPRNALNIMDSRGSFGNKMKQNNEKLERTFSFNERPGV